MTEIEMGDGDDGAYGIPRLGNSVTVTCATISTVAMLAAGAR
jgi:hypothetical protein